MTSPTSPPSPGRFAILCFTFNLILAIALFILVVLTPWLSTGIRLLDLFAHDGTVRRTALAAAIGLTVTAFVFFQASPTSSRSPTSKVAPRQSPTNVVGA
jgi:hypothetical protein